MAADGKNLVPLRQKTRKKNQEICGMSRRRISCKDLGLADCQGWLYKKKEKGGFIGNKWKKFWCVLKASSLYWYSSQLAEKAEGFLSLPNFTVERATECKKKHAMKIIHPHIKTFYFAAENGEEMNRWLSKLGLAVSNDQANKKNEEGREDWAFKKENKKYHPKTGDRLQECYSESEHEDPEINAETPPPPYSDQLQLPPSDTQDPFLTSCVSNEASCSLSSPESIVMKSQSSSSSSLSKALQPERQSWLDFVNSSSVGEELGNQPSATSGDSDDPDLLAIDYHETMGSGTAKPEGSFRISSDKCTSSLDGFKDNLPVPVEMRSKTLSKDRAKCSEDEMEKLYKSLEQASLSPIGDRRPSTKKELRKSFIKRSKNPSVNEKLHKIRALNSTLKCKEHDLAMINQLLEDTKLTARRFREWKNTNTMLVQDIYQQQDLLNTSQENVVESGMAMQPSFMESTI